MIRTLLTSWFAIALLTAFGQAGSNDPTFHPTDVGAGNGANSYIASVILQPDEKILIGGNFTSYDGTARNRIARLNIDGSLDTSFDPGTGTNGPVNAIAMQADGKILIGGAFTTYDGTTCENLVRLNPTGGLDNTFQPEIIIPIYSIVVQPDGMILTGGEVDMTNLSMGKAVKRLNPDGSRDLDFHFEYINDLDAYSLNLQPDGKIIVAGILHRHGVGQYNIPAFRLNTDGSLDSTFIPLSLNYSTTAYASAVQPDGKILLAGNFSFSTGYKCIIRLNADGKLDLPFYRAHSGMKKVFSLSLQADGKVVIGGNFESLNNNHQYYLAHSLARLNGDGSVDTSFDLTSGADNSVFSTTIQPDGKILIGGRFLTYGGDSRTRLARVIGCNDGEPCAGPSGLVLTPSHETRIGLVDANVALRVWPNPSDGERMHLTVDGLGDDLQQIEIELYDAMGRRTIATTLPVAGGRVNTVLELGHTAPGAYLLKVIEGEKTHSTRMVVVN